MTSAKARRVGVAKKRRTKSTAVARLPADVAEDLRRSGLTPVDARVLKIESLSAHDTGTITRRKFRSRTSYKIPYFDLDGKVIDFFRLRFLGDCAPTELRDGKALKYYQPPKTMPHVYLPPYLKWRAVVDDPAVPIYIVEGEKKAALGTKLLQVPVIGLGGIWSWGARKSGDAVVPELVPFLSKGRKVYIVFDSEPVENLDVNAAREHLANAAWQRGAEPFIVTLPLVDGEKTGLDDFLVKRGVDAFSELEPLPTQYAQALAELNTELCYVEQQHAVYHLRTGAMFSRVQHLTQLVYANRKVLTVDRAGNPVEKNLVSEWLGWAGRRSHSVICYDPGGPKVTPTNGLNVWPGWGTTPKRGSVSLFLELIDRFFEGSNVEHRQWFLRWLAYPLQYPGTKLAQACVLFSRDHGTGKSLLGYHLGKIYGDNFVVLNAEALHSSFNTWARYKQFVLGEELTGSERRADAERLKLLVTQEKVTINAKFQPTYELTDRCNYLLTTNHADALNLDVYDRRFFVHEITSDKLPKPFFQHYDRWYKGPDGPSALFHYLMELDLANFSPYGDAPSTRAKAEMQQLSDLPVDYIIREVIDAPDKFLTIAGKTVERDLFTPREVVAMIDLDGKRKITEQAVAKALRRAGVRQLDATKTKLGTVRLYALRNQKKWLTADHAARAKHYDGDVPTT